MRILLLSQFLPPVAGGEERHVWNLARTLAARSHEVTLLGFATGESPAGTTAVDGLRVVRVRTAASRLPVLYSDPSRPHALPLPDPQVSRAIAEEFAGGRYDIAHAHNWIVNSALGPAAKAGVPLVMTLHDYSHVCATKRLMEHGRSRCPGPGLRRCLSCASEHYGSVNGAVTVIANAAAAHRRARRLTDVAAVSSAVADAVAIPAGHRALTVTPGSCGGVTALGGTRARTSRSPPPATTSFFVRGHRCSRGTGKQSRPLSSWRTTSSSARVGALTVRPRSCFARRPHNSCSVCGPLTATRPTRRFRRYSRPSVPTLLALSADRSPGESVCP